MLDDGWSSLDILRCLIPGVNAASMVAVCVCVYVCVTGLPCLLPAAAAIVWFSYILLLCCFQ